MTESNGQLSSAMPAEDDERQQMSAEAQAFVELSNSLLNEALSSCQLEPFNAVSLEIPDMISADKEPPQSISQDVLWRQINDLYASQSALFSPKESIPTDLSADGDSSQLNDVSKMLDM